MFRSKFSLFLRVSVALSEVIEKKYFFPSMGVNYESRNKSDILCKRTHSNLKEHALRKVNKLNFQKTYKEFSIRMSDTITSSMVSVGAFGIWFVSRTQGAANTTKTWDQFKKGLRIFVYDKCTDV